MTTLIQSKYKHKRINASTRSISPANICTNNLVYTISGNQNQWNNQTAYWDITSRLY